MVWSNAAVPLPFLVNKLYELNSGTLFALPTAHTVWLVPTAERHRGWVVRVQTSLLHQVKRVRCSHSPSHFKISKKEKEKRKAIADRCFFFFLSQCLQWRTAPGQRLPPGKEGPSHRFHFLFSVGGSSEAGEPWKPFFTFWAVYLLTCIGEKTT